MKYIMGIIPCKDRFFLDKALLIVKSGVEELSALTNGEDSYFKIATDLYTGQKQLMMAYQGEDEIPEEKEQETVIGKLLSGKVDNFVGYVILELWPSSIHIYQAYSKVLNFTQYAYANIEKQAKLLGAPFLSLCTNEITMAQRFGFIPTYTMFRKKIGA